MVYNLASPVYGHQTNRLGTVMTTTKRPKRPDGYKLGRSDYLPYSVQIECLTSNPLSRVESKYSCLNPFPGSVLIDACAAPGMKTSQALANIYPDGKCIAVERNAKRFKTLNDLLEKHTVVAADNVNNPNIETIRGDFLEMNPDDYSNVEYIMVDPTCSGSGLSFSTTIEKDAERITKLSNLQVMILKHALKFRGLKKIVYSTCSVFEEENENVIQEILAENSEFKLARALPAWNRRCAQDKCLKVDPEKDLCTGFFVAVLVKRKKFRQTTHDI